MILSKLLKKEKSDLNFSIGDIILERPIIDLIKIKTKSKDLVEFELDALIIRVGCN